MNQLSTTGNQDVRTGSPRVCPAGASDAEFRVKLSVLILQGLIPDNIIADWLGTAKEYSPSFVNSSTKLPQDRSHPRPAPLTKKEADRIDNNHKQLDRYRNPEKCSLPIITYDRDMLGLLEKINQVSKKDYSVLITGETGTGKEIVAQAIHENSARRGKRIVIINCAAFPEHLLESELFGHIKGAFTGATQDKQGLFSFADGGTVFLDEIGCMPITLQVKLLRFLQEREVRPIGSTQTHHVDIRVIAATNDNLETLIDQGRFRRDLFYRLEQVSFLIPPLRERVIDVPFLAEYFLQKEKKTMCREANKLLMAYSWPGNVRELQNILKSASLSAYASPIIRLHNLPERILSLSKNALNSKDKMEFEQQKTALKAALERNHWDIKKAHDELIRLSEYEWPPYKTLWRHITSKFNLCRPKT